MTYFLRVWIFIFQFMERVSPLKSPKLIQLFCASVEATFPLDFESTIPAPSWGTRNKRHYWNSRAKSWSLSYHCGPPSNNPAWLEPGGWYDSWCGALKIESENNKHFFCRLVHVWHGGYCCLCNFSILVIFFGKLRNRNRGYLFIFLSEEENVKFSREVPIDKASAKEPFRDWNLLKPQARML